VENKRRHNSFAEELLEAHEYEEDPRLNNSCVLDGLLKPAAEKRIVLRKANSVELIRKPYYETADPDNVLTNPKKLAYFFHESVVVLKNSS
jgi:hypothetical protein